MKCFFSLVQVPNRQLLRLFHGRGLQFSQQLQLQPGSKLLEIPGFGLPILQLLLRLLQQVLFHLQSPKEQRGNGSTTQLLHQFTKLQKQNWRTREHQFSLIAKKVTF